jgi:hypothetical protein
MVLGKTKPDYKPIALAAVTAVFVRPGEPPCSCSLLDWQLTATSRGLIVFASIVPKPWLSVQMATLLAATTSFPDLLRAMRALHAQSESVLNRFRSDDVSRLEAHLQQAHYLSAGLAGQFLTPGVNRQDCAVPRQGDAQRLA